MSPAGPRLLHLHPGAPSFHLLEHLMGPLEARIGRMERQLLRWGARLDTLDTPPEEAGLAARIEYRFLLDDLIQKHEHAQAKLDEFRIAGADQWDALKDGVESAWGDLESAFDALHP